RDCARQKWLPTPEVDNASQNWRYPPYPGAIRQAISQKISKHGIKNDHGNPQYNHDPKQSTKLVDVMGVVVLLMARMAIVLMVCLLCSLVHARSFRLSSVWHDLWWLVGQKVCI